MRVIAGRAKGRQLQMKAGLPVRPTGDKVKGAIFNILATRIVDAHFLDLFAGSGAIGIEAWSRGAARVVFVEKDRRVFAALQANLQMVGFTDASCQLADFATALSGMREQFDIIFVDPPYQAGLYQQVMSLLAEHGLLRAGGLLCLEHARDLQLPETSSWRVVQQRKYGDTMITILNASC